MLLKTRSFTWIGILALMLAVTVSRADAELGEAFLADFAPPDSAVLQAAKRGLENYQDTRQYKNEWLIEINEQNGTIETNWFPEHKAEVILKVQIVVWGRSFRVDAWQKTGWLFKSVEKTEWSRRTERRIQDRIAQQLTAHTQ